MEEGYQRKINSIIDKIIDGKIEFNRKTIKEQNDIKSDMVTSINNAVSSLNNLGQKLVLEELDSMVSQKSAEIFDSNGNINTSELTKLTNMIVKSTIEDAQKKGINVIRDVAFRTKESIADDTILTVVVIENMIKNYGNLSLEEQKELWNNYDKMSREQQRNLENANINKWKELARNTKDPSIKEQCESMVKLEEYIQKLLDSNNPNDMYILIGLLNEYEQFRKEFGEDVNLEKCTKEQIMKYCKLFFKQDPDKQEFLRLYDLYNSERENSEGNDEYIKKMISLVPKEFIETLSKENTGILGHLPNDSPERQNFIITKYKTYIKSEADRNKIYIECMETPEFLKEHNIKPPNLPPVNRITDFLQENQESKGYKMQEKVGENSEKEDNFSSDQDMLAEIFNFQAPNLLEKNESEKIYKKVQQLPNILGKVNFSEQDIQEALTQYKIYIERYSTIDSQTADDIKKTLPEDIVLEIKNDFYSSREDGQISENVHKILDVIAEITFDGKIQQILTDAEIREAFLQELENIATRSAEVQGDIQLDDEFEKVFGRYFAETSVDMFVADPKALTENRGELGEDSSTTFQNNSQEPRIDRDDETGSQDSSSKQGIEKNLEKLDRGEEEQYTPTLKPEEVQLGEPVILDVTTVKDIVEKNALESDLNQAAEFLNILGKDMLNPDKPRAQGNHETDFRNIEDTDDDNR